MTSEPNYQYTFKLEEFVPESQKCVKEYICLLCKGVVNDAFIDKGGSIYCKTCAFKNVEFYKVLDTKMRNAVISTSGDKPIILQEPIAKMVFPDTIIENHIVICKNKEKGCEWTGKSKDCFQHIQNSCSKAMIDCKNTLCTEKISREEMDHHLENCLFKLVSCPTCSQELLNKDLQMHLPECPRRLVECDNNCGEKVAFLELQIHKTSQCGMNEIFCDYKQFGCLDSMLRKDLPQHIMDKNEEHNIQLVSVLFTMKEDTDKQFDQLSIVAEEIKKQIKYYDEQIKLSMKMDKLDIDKNYNNTHNHANNHPNNHTNLHVNNHTSNEEKVKKEKNKKQILAQNKNNEELVKSEIESKNISNINNQTKVLSRKRPRNDKKFEKSEESSISSKAFETNFFIKKDIFLISKGLKLKGSDKIFVSKSNLLPIKVALIDIDLYSGPSKYNVNNVWKVDLEKTKGWWAVGVCWKDSFIKDNFAFNFLLPSHGAFILTSDGLIFNSNSSKQNNLKDLNGFTKNLKVFDMEYDYKKEELIIKSGKDFVFTIVSTFSTKRNATLSPCVLLKEVGDEITFNIF
jgi:hypothetical protein